jgi:hypothetical protein
MTTTYHNEIVQGTDEWHAARCGILTASQVKLILTPTLKVANNEKTRAHVYELAAQRISQYTEPSYIGDDMLRGMEDEYLARALYSATYAPVAEVGFVTNEDHGFVLGYSPDGLVGDDGLIEIKSRKQKLQVQTIAAGEVPDEHVMQLQAGLLATGRAWIDYISYSSGLPMATIRVYPDADIQAAIISAGIGFEAQVQAVVDAFFAAVANPDRRHIATECRIESMMQDGEYE